MSAGQTIWQSKEKARPGNTHREQRALDSASGVGSRDEAQNRNEGRKLEKRETDKRKVCKAGRLFKGHMENLRIF
ncbi:unnamed protein product [Sphagnum balticum]